MKQTNENDLVFNVTIHSFPTTEQWIFKFWVDPWGFTVSLPRISCVPLKFVWTFESQFFTLKRSKWIFHRLKIQNNLQNSHLNFVRWLNSTFVSSQKFRSFHICLARFCAIEIVCGTFLSFQTPNIVRSTKRKNMFNWIFDTALQTVNELFGR